MSPVLVHPAPHGHRHVMSAKPSPPPPPPSSQSQGSVVVAVRCRPFNATDKGTTPCLQFHADGKGVQIANSVGGQQGVFPFMFDYSYPDTVPQVQLFLDIGAPVVQAAFDGFNACIFAYGQTGSGKSHTMMGPRPASARLEAVTAPTLDSSAGLIPRIISAVFEGVANRLDADTALSFKVDVTYLEVYQDRVNCLLDAKKKGSAAEAKKKESLDVRQHPTEGVFVNGLTKKRVNNPAEALTCAYEGDSHRQTAATDKNERSSRSHAVFSLVVRQIRKIKMSNGESVTTELKSQVNLVDLAGSERRTKQGAAGEGPSSRRSAEEEKRIAKWKRKSWMKAPPLIPASPPWVV